MDAEIDARLEIFACKRYGVIAFHLESLETITLQVVVGQRLGSEQREFLGYVACRNTVAVESSSPAMELLGSEVFDKNTGQCAVLRTGGGKSDAEARKQNDSFHNYDCLSLAYNCHKFITNYYYSIINGQLYGNLCSLTLKTKKRRKPERTFSL